MRVVSNQSIPGRFTVMNTDSMNDDVANILKCEASTVSDVNVMATAIDGLVAIHDEFLTELDGHVRGEDDP